MTIIVLFFTLWTVVYIIIITFFLFYRIGGSFQALIPIMISEEEQMKVIEGEEKEVSPKIIFIVIIQSPKIINII